MPIGLSFTNYFIEIKYFLFSFLWVTVPVIHKVSHDVVREGAVPRLGAALGVDGVLGVAELMQ